MPAFDPANALAVVCTRAEWYVKPHLIEWLTLCAGVPLDRIRYVHPTHCMAVTYNVAVKLALASGADHLVFADGDIVPQAGPAAPFLAADADVVGAVYATECEGAFDRPDAVHTGLWRCRGEVLAGLPAPWFRWVYDRDGCRLADCLCGPFFRRVRAAGFSVARAGHVGHRPRGG